MLCLSPLAIMGLESYFSGATSTNEVAKVGDQSISRMEYQEGIASRRNELTQNGIDASAINTSVLNSEVLKGLVNRALLRNQSSKLGMHVSDQVINDMLLTDEQFLDENGQFSNDRFAFSLRQQGITKEQLFNQYRQQLNLMQLYNSVAQTALYPNSDINDLIALQQETREIWLHRIDWESYKDDVTVSAADIESYYNEHKNELNSLAQVDLSYILLDPSKLPNETVSDKEIQAQYDQFKANYASNYSQKISQILVTGDDAKTKIDAIKKRIDAGESFEKLAQELSEDSISAKKGGDIGTFNAEAFGEDGSKVANAIQNLAEGDVSAPIQTSFGYQLFKVTDISGDPIPSIEDVREDLVAQAQRLKKEQLIADKITRINDMALDGVGINDIAQQEELTVHKIKDYTKTENQTALNQPAVINAAFDDFTIQDESVSPSVKINKGTVWVQPSNYRPVAPLTLQEASADIKRILVKQKATEKALAAAKAIADKVNDAGMSAVNVSFQSLGEVSRQSPQLMAAEKAVAFNTDADEGKRIAISQKTDRGASVMVMSRINSGSLDDLPEAERTQASQLLKQSRGQEQFTDYLEYLRDSTEIVKNDATINDVAGL